MKRHFRELGVRRRRPSRSPSSASATCPATCSATGCCSRIRSGSSPRSTTAMCSSIPSRTRSVVRRAQAPLRAARLVVGRLRPLADLRRAAASGRAPRSRSSCLREAQAALGIETSGPLTPNEVFERNPQSAGRPLLERRHRHVRQGLVRGQRRRRRPHERRDPRERRRPAGTRRRRGRQPRLHAEGPDRVRRDAAARSTPTRSTTPPASTAPTTRST